MLRASLAMLAEVRTSGTTPDSSGAGGTPPMLGASLAEVGTSGTTSDSSGARGTPPMLRASLAEVGTSGTTLDSSALAELAEDSKWGGEPHISKSS